MGLRRRFVIRAKNNSWVRFVGTGTYSTGTVADASTARVRVQHGGVRGMITHKPVAASNDSGFAFLALVSWD